MSPTFRFFFLCLLVRAPRARHRLRSTCCTCLTAANKLVKVGRLQVGTTECAWLGSLAAAVGMALLLDR